MSVPPHTTTEKLACGKLTLAKLWADAGNLDKVQEYCDLIVKTYAGTTMGQSKRRLLWRSMQPCDEI